MKTGNAMDVEILGTNLSGVVYLGNLRANATWSHAHGIVAVQLQTADLTTANLIELRQLVYCADHYQLESPATSSIGGRSLVFTTTQRG